MISTMTARIPATADGSMRAWPGRADDMVLRRSIRRDPASRAPPRPRGSESASGSADQRGAQDDQRDADNAEGEHRQVLLCGANSGDIGRCSDGSATAMVHTAPRGCRPPARRHAMAVIAGELDADIHQDQPGHGPQQRPRAADRPAKPKSTRSAIRRGDARAACRAGAAPPQGAAGSAMTTALSAERRRSIHTTWG